MNYEIVNLEAKTMVGVSAVTGNDDPQMGKIIGGLWAKLYEDGIQATIKNKVNEYAIGLYSDYTKDSYCVTAGCEVSKPENAELTVKIIPAGKYAKFSIHGDMQKAAAEAWEKIWKMDLNRRFTGDFEEYLNNDWENADINLFIAIQ